MAIGIIDGFELVHIQHHHTYWHGTALGDQNFALERFFDVPDPRLRVLEALPYQLYAAKVVEEPV